MSDVIARNVQEAIHFPHESLSPFSEDSKYTETTRYLCVSATHFLHGKSSRYPVPRLSLWSILPSADRSWHEKAEGDFGLHAQDARSRLSTDQIRGDVRSHEGECPDRAPGNPLTLIAKLSAVGA
jgi:hypothetical protein